MQSKFKYVQQEDWKFGDLENMIYSVPQQATFATLKLEPTDGPGISRIMNFNNNSR